MVRVLLALDDFNELTQFEVLLRKVGLDVDTVHQTKKFEEVYLGLNPKVIVASSHGVNVDGVAMLKQVQRRNGFPKIIFVIPSGRELSIVEFNDLDVDYFFQSPVNPILLLKKITTLAELDFEIVRAKLEKIKGSLKTEDPAGLLRVLEDAEIQMVENEADEKRSEREDGGGMALSHSGLSPEERSQRFDRWTKKVGVIDIHKNLSKKKVREFRKEIRAEEGEDDLLLNQKRSAFVKALFDKKK